MPGYVYFMSNKKDGVIYIGVTKDLIRRVWEHQNKINRGFTAKYNADKLAYFEAYESIVEAIAQEKKLKNIKRSKKIEIIERANAEWRDLAEEVFGPRSCAAALPPAG
jgi:putative endonuclease